MKFYKNHSTIWNLFATANIHSIIAPYGFSMPYPKFEFTKTCRIISLPECWQRCNKQNVEIRTLHDIHAKMAIGYNGVLFGSFNFSKTNTNKELIAYFDSPQEIEESLCEFDYWWNLATPVKP